MRNIVLTFCTVSLVLMAQPAYADDSVVLIVSADSSIKDVSSINVRKLYLGFTVQAPNGKPIHAITNASDKRLWDIFLQGVMGMSERYYDRRLLTLTLQSGRSRPAVISNLDTVLLTVITDKNALAFVGSDDVKNRDDISVLRVLWQD